ncbi:MAG: SAM-dependent methyltransferase [Bdellovibrionales bacterium]|jgi:NADH dehydrogenase [ubiquinone] 1 alpha subcomplex assembly factor 7
MNALENVIRDIIATQGAISMAAYMELAMMHPVYGYYRTHEPLGREGDFITSPEVSQLFGEMLGVWCVEAWKEIGSPDSFALVEFGPGRGTMMQDILRSTAKVGGFHAAKKLYLVDSNETLRKLQQEALKDYAPQYIDDISQIPQMPVLIIANEFLDALPVRQFEKTFQGWAERMVTVENGALTMALRPLTEMENKLIPPTRSGAMPGAVFEFSPQAQSLVRELSREIVSRKGAMLLIDYGYMIPSGSSTVQAVSRHAATDVFERPGEVDLTVHIDFAALSRAASEGGARVSQVVGQGEFLKNCGIEIRANSLKTHATDKQAIEIDSALGRLIDDEQMGSLFKVIEIKE